VVLKLATAISHACLAAKPSHVGPMKSWQRRGCGAAAAVLGSGLRCTAMRSWAGAGAGPSTALLLGWLVLGQKGEEGWASEARNRPRQAGSERCKIGRGRLVKWAKHGKKEGKKRKKKKNQSRPLEIGPRRGLENSKAFNFQILFKKTQTNLDSIQIQILNDSSHKIKSKSTHHYKIKLYNGMLCNKQIFIWPKLI
jgi:hypothetical protein